MVRRRSCAVSNHEDVHLILRDAAKTPLLRMRGKLFRLSPSLRANGSRECAPDDRLREAIQRLHRRLDCFVAWLLAMTKGGILLKALFCDVSLTIPQPRWDD
jgi:hypothetical protein